MINISSPLVDDQESSTPLSVSCATDRGIYDGYWKALEHYELSHQDLATKVKRLRVWREQAPSHAQFTARINPDVISHFDTLEITLSFLPLKHNLNA